MPAYVPYPTAYLSYFQCLLVVDDKHARVHLNIHWFHDIDVQDHPLPLV